MNTASKLLALKARRTARRATLLVAKIEEFAGCLGNEDAALSAQERENCTQALLEMLNITPQALMKATAADHRWWLAQLVITDQMEGPLKMLARQERTLMLYARFFPGCRTQ